MHGFFRNQEPVRAAHKIKQNFKLNIWENVINKKAVHKLNRFIAEDWNMHSSVRNQKQNKSTSKFMVFLKKLSSKEKYLIWTLISPKRKRKIWIPSLSLTIPAKLSLSKKLYRDSERKLLRCKGKSANIAEKKLLSKDSGLGFWGEC